MRLDQILNGEEQKMPSTLLCEGIGAHWVERALHNLEASLQKSLWNPGDLMEWERAIVSGKKANIFSLLPQVNPSLLCSLRVCPCNEDKAPLKHSSLFSSCPGGPAASCAQVSALIAHFCVSLGCCRAVSGNEARSLLGREWG